MLYEKKIMILTGRGKGVVLVERSGLGVKFALRTFSLPARTEYKAGIITPKNVIIRDLPATRDPAAVFFVDDVPLHSLHFAVFDNELILYGATGVKMWEANVMDILMRHCAPARLDIDIPPAPSLPPLVEKPRVLPLPDGTGIPQSRLAIYGDETLAGSDFYTPFDLSSHMPELDAFLDAPRVLTAENMDALAAARDCAAAAAEPVTVAATDDIAPPSAAVAAETIDTPSPTEPQASTETSAQTVEQTVEQNASAPEPTPITSDADAASAESAPTAVTETSAPSVENDMPRESDIRTDISEDSMNEHFTNGNIDANANANASAIAADERSGAAAEQQAAERDGIREAAACTDLRAEKPWEMTARWLKNRASRETVVRRPTVQRVADIGSVPKLREVSFFERLGADIKKLFSSAPRDGELTALLPDIEWVKIAVDRRNSVSVGRSGDAFLCYAVAGEYEKTPPIENAQWLPKLRTAPTGKGYWLVFQDLGSGNIIV